MMNYLSRKLFVRNLLQYNIRKFNNKNETIFDKIINQQIKSEIIYEDKWAMVFKDVQPAAPIHLLIIPKNKDGLEGISKAEERHIEILGRLFLTAKKVGEQMNLKDGYRLVINEGKNGCI